MLRLNDRGTPDTQPLTLIVKGHYGWLDVERLQMVVPPLLIDIPLTGGVVQVTPDAMPGGKAAVQCGLHDAAVMKFEARTNSGATTAPGEARGANRSTRGGGEPRGRDRTGDLCDRTHIAELIELLRRTYPALPGDACIVVSGTYMPTDGRARRRFVAYSNSAFPPCVALPADGPGRQTLSAFIQAARRATGVRAPAPLRVAPRRVLSGAPAMVGATMTTATVSGTTAVATTAARVSAALGRSETIGAGTNTESATTGGMTYA